MRTTRLLLLLALSFGARGAAQGIAELPAPTVATNAIDMDLVGPAGLTDLATLNAAARPRDARLRALSLTPSLASPSRYDTGTANGRALALDPATAALALIDPPQGTYGSGELLLDLAGPASEIGLGVGDYGGALELELYAGVQLVAAAVTSSFASPGPKFFRCTSGSFDRALVRAPLGANWVLTDLVLQEPDGLFPAFRASVQGGAAPFAVHFADASTTSDPAGIASWAWDFEDDGIIDDTSPNPTFTYTSCGDFDVRLTVSDALHGSASRVERAWIAVDPLLVDFDALPTNGCAPLVVQLRDLSRGGAVSWAWDFENDGIVDSTLQHPLHVFTRVDALFDVRLTVTSVCRPQGASAVKLGFVRTSGALPTLFAANSGGAVGGAVYFDLELRAPLVVTGFETNFDAPLGTPVGLSLYLTAPGLGARGLEQQPAAWTFAAQDDGRAISAGLDRPTRIRLASPVTLAPGRIGVALVASGDGHRYTALVGNGVTRYEDPYLALDLGSATNAPFAGSVFAPRIWNGAVLYCLSCAGAVAAFGTGCADAGGQPLQLYAHGCADLGAPIGLGLSSPGVSPGAAAFLLMGLSSLDWLGLPLPLALDPLGALGCSVYASHDLILGPFPFDAGAIVFATIVPLDGLLSAAPSYWQAYSLDPAQNALGIATSNALAVQLR